jgi:hypothetical protein
MSDYICVTCKAPIEYKHLTAGQCKDCNDNCYPDTIDCIDEILHLKQENQKLKKIVAAHEECLSICEGEHWKVTECINFYRARIETLNKEIKND